MCRQRLGHPRLDLLARLTESEHAFDIGAVGAPCAVLGTFVDDEVVVHRSSSIPVARRIAASVPTGTVSESLPATVTTRVPSALSQVSCDPAWRTFTQPSAPNAFRTSLNFLAHAEATAPAGRVDRGRRERPPTLVNGLTIATGQTRTERSVWSNTQTLARTREVAAQLPPGDRRISCPSRSVCTRIAANASSAPASGAAAFAR